MLSEDQCLGDEIASEFYYVSRRILNNVLHLSLIRTFWFISSYFYIPCSLVSGVGLFLCHTVCCCSDFFLQIWPSTKPPGVVIIALLHVSYPGASRGILIPLDSYPMPENGSCLEEVHCYLRFRRRAFFIGLNIVIVLFFIVTYSSVTFHVCTSIVFAQNVTTLLSFRYPIFSWSFFRLPVSPYSTSTALCIRERILGFSLGERNIFTLLSTETLVSHWVRILFYSVDFRTNNKQHDNHLRQKMFQPYYRNDPVKHDLGEIGIVFLKSNCFHDPKLYWVNLFWGAQNDVTLESFFLQIVL